MFLERRTIGCTFSIRENEARLYQIFRLRVGLEQLLRYK